MAEDHRTWPCRRPAGTTAAVESSLTGALPSPRLLASAASLPLALPPALLPALPALLPALPALPLLPPLRQLPEPFERTEPCDSAESTKLTREAVPPLPRLDGVLRLDDDGVLREEAVVAQLEGGSLGGGYGVPRALAAGGRAAGVSERMLGAESTAMEEEEAEEEAEAEEEEAEEVRVEVEEEGLEAEEEREEVGEQEAVEAAAEGGSGFEPSKLRPRLR